MHAEDEEVLYKSMSSKAKLAMQLFTIVLSYDSMVTFMSIYFYWIAISDANTQLYGVAFASYAAGALIGAPVFALWNQKRNIFEPAVLSLVLNFIGNVLYFFAIIFVPTMPIDPDNSNYPAAICMFLFGRFIAGIGNGGSTLGMSYLISNSNEAKRLEAMNTFRSWQFWGKFSGPLVASLLLYVGPFQIGTSNLVLNGATIAPLTSMLLVGLITIPVGFFLFGEKAKEYEGEKVPIWKDREAKPILLDAVKVMVVVAASIFGLYLVFAQIMPIGLILFGIGDDNPDNIWLIYLPPIIGAVLGMILVKRVVVPMGVRDEYILIACCGGVTVGLFTFFQFAINEPAYIYFVGASLLFLSNGILSVALRTIYSLVIGNSRHMSTLTSLLFVSTSLGQIIGPIVASWFMGIENADTAECPEYACFNGGEDGGLDYACCKFTHLNAAVLIAVTVMGLATIYAAIIFGWIGLPTIRNRVISKDIGESTSINHVHHGDVHDSDDRPY